MTFGPVCSYSARLSVCPQIDDIINIRAKHVWRLESIIGRLAAHGRRGNDVTTDFGVTRSDPLTITWRCSLPGRKVPCRGTKDGPCRGKIGERPGTYLTTLLSFPTGDTRGSWGKEGSGDGTTAQAIAVKFDSEGTEVFRWQVRVCFRGHRALRRCLFLSEHWLISICKEGDDGKRRCRLRKVHVRTYHGVFGT